MKFRKKPVVIEAVTVDSALQAASNDWSALPKWLADHYEIGGVVFVGTLGIYLPTLEGSMLAKRGDWIVRGVKGEIYPCRADIFAETYEEVES